MRNEERGSALPLLAALVGVAAMTAAGLVHMAVWIVARAEAQAVADLVALAAAVEGRSGAEDLAERNNATVTSYEEAGEVVVVEVELGRVTARAAAHHPASIHDPGPPGQQP